MYDTVGGSLPSSTWDHVTRERRPYRCSAVSRASSARWVTSATTAADEVIRICADWFSTSTTASRGNGAELLQMWIFDGVIYLALDPNLAPDDVVALINQDRNTRRARS